MNQDTGEPRIPKRISSALFNSLGAGVTPRVGLDRIVVGRENEIRALLTDLDTVKDGGSTFRVMLGRFGSGKSFLLQLLRGYAVDRNFVVADVDLSPERRLTGTKGQGLGTYRELTRNLATRTRPDGGALQPLLERWVDALKQQAMKEQNVRPTDPGLTDLVEQRIYESTQQLESLVHGFDFASVVSAYWRGHRQDDDGLKSSALRWLRGEYSTKTEARQDLGVRVIIDDESWYDYLKLFAEFVRVIGYKGLVVIVDEAVNLYKISNTTSRNNNYEKFLTILNDTLQGKASGLAVLIGGTPMFLEDPRRGLFSYEAIRTRLQTSRFVRQGLVDLSSPVIRLAPLTNEEILVLLQRIRELHALHHGYASSASDADLVFFMEEVLNRLGAREFLTPRDVIRDFVGILNLVHQNPGASFRQMVGGSGFTPTESGAEDAMRAEDAVDDSFTDFDL